MKWVGGCVTSPIFDAALRMSSHVFFPLLLANFTSAPSLPSSSPPVHSLLDQVCKWNNLNFQPKQQSVREWAKEWEETGSYWKEAPSYKGLLAKLEDAEKGESHLLRQTNEVVKQHLKAHKKLA